MRNFNFKQQVQALGHIILGVGIHHYGSKLLDKNVSKMEEQAQIQRDEQITRIENKLDHMGNKMETLSNKLDSNQIISPEHENLFKNKFTAIKESKESIENSINSTNISEESKSKINEHLNNIVNNCEEVTKVIEKWITGDKGGKSLVSDFVNNIHNYLDSLTLLEESAFLHILLFILLLLTVFNILSIFFGNEIIKYFELERKYPKLNTFFRIRTTFQRYYLLWSMFELFVLCLAGIFINRLVFYAK